jgi:ElaA protein
VELFDRSFEELSTREFHDIMALRVDVFVVEQACAYAELDGRDTEPGTRHLWLAAGGIRAYLRVLDEGDNRRIGRVVTAAEARGEGLAARLVDHAVASTRAPWVLDAQSHLEAWYSARGFVVAGAEFVEDGIPHIPMRRG